MADATPSFFCALFSGAVAGPCTDIMLYPIDTIKTRLQASQGFYKAGGFRGIFSGLAPAAIGSAPGSMLFFCTYEKTKQYVAPIGHTATDSIAAAAGELAGCLVSVPTDNVKLRMQVGAYSSMSSCVRGIFKESGFRGFYRGYMTSAMREIPFSAIQMSLYEASKRAWKDYSGESVGAAQAPLLGSISGGIAGAVTTPLDVTKTRLMLGNPCGGMMSTMANIYKTEGVRALFSGIVPRVLWMSGGGAVFLTAYEQAKHLFIDII